MKETWEKVTQILRNRMDTILFGTIGVIFLFSSFFAYHALKQPLSTVEKTVHNTIEEKRSINFEIETKPSKLYPNGGTIIPDDVIFTRLTDHLIITIGEYINTAEDVKLEANTSIVYSLSAKDMWEREFELVPPQSISSEGTSFTLLQNKLRIDIKKILSYIQSIEEETFLKPSSYLLVIKPQVNGFLHQSDSQSIYEINSDIILPFELSDHYMKYIGESYENEFINSNMIEHIKTLSGRVNYLGYSFPVKWARVIFSSISIISCLLLCQFFFRKVLFNRIRPDEVDLIEKKHKGKIIEVSDKIRNDMYPYLGLKSFKVLLQIADEKDEPILRYTDTGMVYYYILGNSTVYYYGVEKNCS